MMLFPDIIKRRDQSSVVQSETNVFPWTGTEEMDVNNLISDHIMNE